MTRLARALVAATLLSGGQLAAAEEDLTGQELAWKYHCVTCHGAQGKSADPRYPHLAGQDQAYLVARLQYFRDYTEPFNHMNGQAEPLTDEMMSRLAGYFSALPR